ncbi:hypothetical protein FRC04_011856 [Tulasnella sp. 424]|nr:hypothetical protein FRC04_011856 [Tulasnella sp. 424]KAG8971409.1 hypothetical protein FRC05_011088 [Tulasnella sp. 425]
MIASSSQSSSRNVEVVHRPSSASVSRPEEQLVTDFARNSTVLQDGYEAPFGYNGNVQTILSSLKRSPRAFPSHPDRTFHLEFADGGNTKIEVSVGDDAPDDLDTYVGVHGMAGDVDAPYLHEILGPLIKDGCARGIVFNLRGCGDSTATSPALHHGGSTSDLGAVITWVTMKWPKSKIYIIGTSLGGVITAKTIGQWGDGCPVSAVALVSPVHDFAASCKAMETQFVSRTVFNPAVGAHYAKLVKKSKDGFDLEHWAHTRPTPFPPSSLGPPLPPLLPFPAFPDQELSREFLPFAQGTRTSSFMSSSSGTAPGPSSLFSASGSTQGTSPPSTPSAHSTSFCLSSTPPSTPVPEHTADIKAALAKSLQKIMSGRRILPQTLTKFSKGFVAATAHYLSGDEFMAGTSAVNDLPNIRVPCLAVNCADDPLMPGEHLPRSQAMESPFVVMAVPKKGGHLGTFTTKRWKKRHGNKRYHTALVEEWFKANDDMKQLRPRPQILHAQQGFVYPEGHPQMAFRETTALYLKLKYTRPIYPKPSLA